MQSYLGLDFVVRGEEGIGDIEDVHLLAFDKCRVERTGGTNGRVSALVLAKFLGPPTIAVISAYRPHPLGL